ncbi:hypothetical protein VNO77_19357 [Canavalia gladiata]|uniref:Uncharacterized protein n=1 Tax=Canavalia gladiata TaxID=3824 RepID=A0AAN9LMI1_CANGL
MITSDLPDVDISITCVSNFKALKDHFTLSTPKEALINPWNIHYHAKSIRNQACAKEFVFPLSFQLGGIFGWAIRI